MSDVEGYVQGHRSRRRRAAWSSTNLGNVAARQELLGALLATTGPEIEAGGRLLDSGCGTGWLLEALAEAGVAPSRLHGLDADADRVIATRTRVPGARVDVGDATALPYADGTFTAVYFIVSLSSMGSRTQIRAALSEGRRVLAPGGALAIYEPRLPTPLNPGTRRVTRADLRGAGISTTETRSLTVLPPLGRRLGRLTKKVYPVLSQLRVFRSHRLVVHRDCPARSG